mmetsp:Transcript_45907/g.80676  ORF Transcript_45907/g.80676 Transcript_45907/m.80676 type:complete len:88 (-) Transcript_45907:395-658(-)
MAQRCEQNSGGSGKWICNNSKVNHREDETEPKGEYFKRTKCQTRSGGVSCLAENAVQGSFTGRFVIGRNKKQAEFEADFVKCFEREC